MNEFEVIKNLNIDVIEELAKENEKLKEFVVDFLNRIRSAVSENCESSVFEGIFDEYYHLALELNIYE